MAIIRRLLGLSIDTTEAEAQKAREEQYEQVRRGLEEARQRAQFLEIRADLEARNWHRDQS